MCHPTSAVCTEHNTEHFVVFTASLTFCRRRLEWYIRTDRPFHPNVPCALSCECNTHVRRCIVSVCCLLLYVLCLVHTSLNAAHPCMTGHTPCPRNIFNSLMEIVEWVYFMIARKHKTAALADFSAHNIARCWWEWVEIKRWWLHLWQTEETVLHEHKPLMDEPWVQLRWRYYYYSNFACHCIFLARWVDPSLQRSISSCQNCNLLFCIDRLPWSKHNFMYFIQFHRVLCWMGILSTTNLPSSQRSSAVPTPQSVYKKKHWQIH